MAFNLDSLNSVGSVPPGHAADIVVFRPVEREFTFGDRPNGNPEQHTAVGQSCSSWCSP